MSKILDLKFLAAAVMMAVSMTSHGANIIRTQAPVNYVDPYLWQQTYPLVGNWIDGATLGCDGWTPDPLSQPFASSFQQLQSCLVEQSRTIQAREVNQDGDIRTKGEPTTESRQASKQTSRSLTWKAVADDIRLAGTELSTVCGDWIPGEDTVASGQPFEQTRSCTITTSYVKQPREAISSLGLLRDAGNPTYYNGTNPSTETRGAVGVMDVWKSADPVLGNWVAGADTGCDGWAPDPLSQANGASFQQNQVCHFTQTRSVQAQEVNQDGSLRDAGAAITETEPSTRIDARNLTWVAIADEVKTSGTPVDTCAEWSPAANTVEVGVSLTQTRTCTSSMPYVKQARESIASLNLTRNVGNPVPFSESTPRSESQSTVGTKPITRAMSIVNPVPGMSGIYSINDGNGGTYKAYVDMQTNGGNWILLARWTGSAATKGWGQVGFKGSATSGWTNDATNYPVIQSGAINASSEVMFVPGHPSWIARYGAWQTFSTFASGAVIGQAGFPAKTPGGNTTLWAYNAGWSIATGAGGTFGLWTAWGNGGPCGGADVVAPTKMCVIASYSSTTNNHFDYTYLKHIYLKATN